MADGQLTVTGKNIKLEPGSKKNQQAISFKGDDRVVLNVETPEGTDTVGIGEDGLYVLNLMLQDTLVGGLVNYGTSTKRARVSDEELSHIIDSTRRLVLGMGASDETKTYFIIPHTIKKVSSDLNSIVVGPSESIPYQLEKKDDKIPEVYKLYTNKEQRETLLSLFRRMR